MTQICSREGQFETPWVKIQGGQGEGDLMVDVLQPPHKEEELDLEYSRELVEAARSRDMLSRGTIIILTRAGRSTWPDLAGHVGF